MKQTFPKIQTSLLLILLVISISFNIRHLHSRLIDYLVESAASNYNTIRLTGFSIETIMLLAAFGLGFSNLWLIYKAIKEEGSKIPVFQWIVFVLFVLLTLITPFVVAGFALPGINNTIGVALATSLVYIAVNIVFVLKFSDKGNND